MEQELNKPGCENCGSPDVEEGFLVPLCKECREVLSKPAVPLWIKVVSAIVIAVMLFSLIKFPDTIKVGAEYERGLKAEKAKKYVTALNKYESVLEHYSDSTAILERLCIAYFKNERVDEAWEVLDKLSGREVKDEETLPVINDAIDKMNAYYYPSEKLYTFMNEHKDENQDQILDSLNKYIEENPEDYVAMYNAANMLFDMGKFDDSQKYMGRIIDSYGDFISANLFMAAIYREKRDFEKALQYCTKVLDYNAESVSAYCSMARIELKRGKDGKALEYSKKGYDMDNNDIYAISTLAMSYHYNGMADERDQLVSLLESFGENAQFELGFLTSIFENRLEWR